MASYILIVCSVIGHVNYLFKRLSELIRRHVLQPFFNALSLSSLLANPYVQSALPICLLVVLEATTNAETQTNQQRKRKLRQLHFITIK